MTIKVDLFYTLKKYCIDKIKGNDNGFDLIIKDKTGITLFDLLKIINIPEEEAGFITMGNKKLDWYYVLRDGDCIKVYPVIIAG